MACLSAVAAAGAEAAPLLYSRRIAPSCPTVVSARRRLVVSCRARRRSLRTAAELPRKSTTNAKPNNGANIQRDEASVSTDKERQEKYEDENGISNLQLEDLVQMIQNTEKNIMLLNQARLQALDHVEKILKEKEDLQRKIKILETRLSETDAQLKLSTEGKFTAEINDSLPILELGNTKEKNMILKDDIQFLKTMFIEVAETEDGIFQLEKERALLDASLRELHSRFIDAQADMMKPGPRQYDTWWEKVENLGDLLETTANKVETAAMVLGRNHDLEDKVDRLEASLAEANRISYNDANTLREMVRKRDSCLREAYLSCRGMKDREIVDIFLKMTLSGTSSGLHIVHIAAEMAPVAKVGGLADVISGLGKALQKKGHLVEIILPKYDCMQNDQVNNLKVLDVLVQSYFEGKLFNNKIWTGTVEGLPVYFIEPQHPAKFFWRAQYYGEHDDFKRFAYFSRAALELLYQSQKKVDIIHCHDWQTAFVAPLYWEAYANLGFNSARICFTCHNFEYQGAAPAQDLACCGLDVEELDREDRMRDNNSHGRINVVKGAIVYSNIVTTVSPTYALEARKEGGRGLQESLKIHSRKFVGILNGIDTDTWNPSTDRHLKVQYNANDIQGKVANKAALRKQLKLSSTYASQPLVGCITRLVPQKGVHLIRHAIYKTAELGGQFVLLGSSPVPHIQREFEGIAEHFQNNNNIRLLLKYDDSLSHWIYAASDMFIVPSMFEPCGLTQMIAMRYGSVPIVRKTGGLNDSVFDFDDETIPMELRNGFTFVNPDEKALSGAMERAFNYYTKKPDVWKQLVQKDMRIDFSWDSSASQYEDIYQRAVARARAAA
uniref:Starch synthase, chloroplastic/amyloplastic n=1 Tax=Leersia perrieri TaxID=77586 RepID=A0A0D9WJ00_9ORYZ